MSPDKKEFWTLKKPCAECPFRKAGNPYILREGRALSIGGDILFADKFFYCHNSLKGKNEAYPVYKNAKNCAGAYLFDKPNGANFTYRMAAALKQVPEELAAHQDEVFTDLQSFVEHFAELDDDQTPPDYVELYHKKFIYKKCQDDDERQH